MALDHSFVLIQAEWPVSRARRLIEGLSPRWIVVYLVYDRRDLYYPIRRRDADLVLSDSERSTVREAFHLRESDAAPTAANEIAAGEKPVVVVSRGQVRGIVPGKARTRGFAQRRTNKGFKTLEAEFPKFPSTVKRAIEATMPSEVALGDTVSLVVKLVMRPSQGDTVHVEAEVGESLDIVVHATGLVQVVGKTDGVLTVTATGTPMLLFKIGGTVIGPGEIHVLVFQRGQSIGSLDLAIRTVAKVTVADSTSATAPLQPVSAEQPDLMLFIIEKLGTYTMYMTAKDPNLKLNLRSFSFSLNEPRKFFDEFYADIEDILTSPATPPQKIQRLGAKGTYLFNNLLSSDARGALWKVRSQIQSVHIQSEEPWVPWELLKPSGDDGTGKVVEAEFLCEKYEVTRWVPGEPHRRDLTMTNVGVVTPPDSGLPAAIPERDQIKRLKSDKRQVTEIEPEELTLRQALADGTLDVIHFTGHGIAGTTSADRSEIRLQSGSRLRPEELTGVVANLGRAKPIVFLNACEVGRAGMGLAQPGGWPRGFVAAGAGAFIGPLWKVADASAAAFAAEFYDKLIAGKSVGAAALAARKAIQAASDPSWLAYTVYAHCDAQLT